MLSIGRTSSYAVSALSHLARSDGAWVQISELSSGIGAPQPYLAKILHSLSESGLVRTKRGYKGGYTLARPADEIAVLEIIEAVEGPNAFCDCLLGRADCCDERACPTHEFWKVERVRIRELLAGLTLASVAEFEGRREQMLMTPHSALAGASNSMLAPGGSARGNGRRQGVKKKATAGRRGNSRGNHRGRAEKHTSRAARKRR